jgi:hypothetical protein
MFISVKFLNNCSLGGGTFCLMDVFGVLSDTCAK